MWVSCRVRGKHNDFIVRYGSNQLPIPALLEEVTRHLYIFEDYFSLNQDSPEAEEVTFSELVFDFIVHDKTWKVKGCGVNLLEVLHHILDGKETEDEDCMDRNKIEKNTETEEEESGGDDDAVMQRYGSTKHHLQARLELDHLYMFEASLSLKEGNNHEAELGFLRSFL